MASTCPPSLLPRRRLAFLKALLIGGLAQSSAPDRCPKRDLTAFGTRRAADTLAAG